MSRRIADFSMDFESRVPRGDRIVRYAYSVTGANVLGGKQYDSVIGRAKVTLWLEHDPGAAICFFCRIETKQGRIDQAAASFFGSNE